MKYLLTILTLIAICIPFWAQDIQSFRNLSTGGALTDDVDLAFDSIELNYLKGTKIFSNLSNFGTNDQILMNNGENHLMFGIATDTFFFKNLKAALLHKFYDNKTPLSFWFMQDPNTPVSAAGEVDYTWQGYFDNNFNGLYDRYHKIEQKYKKQDSHSGDETYLNVAYQMKRSIILGLKIGSIKAQQNCTYANSALLDFSFNDPTTDYYSVTMNLPDMDPTISEYESTLKRTGDFNTDVDLNHMFTDLSCAYTSPSNRLEMRATLSMHSIQDEYLTNDQAQKTTSQTQREEFASFDFSHKRDGMYSAISGSIRINPTPAEYRKDEGFIAIGGGIGVLQMDTDKTEINAATDFVVNNFRFRENATMTEQGKLNGNSLNGFLRLNLPLNQRTYFGTGLLINYDFHREKGDFELTYTSVDTLFNGLGEWTSYSTQDWKMLGITKHEVDFYTMKVPVGIEYWFSSNQRWAMRFGSLFTHQVDSVNEVYQPTRQDPMMTTVYLPDDSQSISIENNSYVIKSENLTTRNTYTTYSYGLCYKPNENLQIDLMGMFDQANTDLWNTNFFRNLRLSFTIGF